MGLLVPGNLAALKSTAPQWIMVNTIQVKPANVMERASALVAGIRSSIGRMMGDSSY